MAYFSYKIFDLFIFMCTFAYVKKREDYECIKGISRAKKAVPQ